MGALPALAAGVECCTAHSGLVGGQAASTRNGSHLASACTVTSSSLRAVAVDGAGKAGVER
eukprot:11655002-Prorocentrum_lima.AAC.1